MRRSIISKGICAIVAALTLVASTARPAGAQLFLVTSRPLLGGTDTIDWSVAGPPLTVLTNPFSINSTNALNVTVSEPAGFFFRTDQDNSYHGNFASGDRLLNSAGSAGPISLLFANAVGGVGAQIQADFFGAFTARIEAFDGANNSLGFFTENGTSNNLADNSAIFIGVGSVNADIKRVEFSVSGTRQPGLTINQVDLSPQTVVPEGDSLALLAAGAVPLLFITGRRMRKVRFARMSRVSWGS